MHGKVQCDNTSNRVTMLVLVDLSLTAETNLSLLELEFLNHLDLKFNNFGKITIPPFRDNVTLATSIQCLDLSVNQLNGSILDRGGNKSG